MGKSVIFVHGRHFKPNKALLTSHWIEALRFGIARDFSTKAATFDSVHVEMAYYGDISNAFLTANGDEYDEVSDIKERKKTLKALEQYKKSQFTKKNYEALPGQGSWEEALADTFAGTLSFLRLSDPLIAHVAPDVREYWNDDTDFATNVRFPMIAPLKAAMDRDDDICIVSHSLGTMIAYDTLWKFCRTGEYRPDYCDKKVSLWITLGSPLSDETVKRNLKGANASGERRFPNNVTAWLNVAAEDDYICHDQKLADDFAEMQELGVVDSIIDERIYNLSVRSNESNPHHEAGYLIHPKVSAAFTEWMIA